MGKMEEGNRRRTKKNEIKKAVLEAIAFAGMLSVFLIAPNAIGAMGKLGIAPSKRQREYVNAARSRLLQQGLLISVRGLVRLTDAGERELRRLQLAEFESPTPKRWDKKWRVIVFDIPEYRKKLRDKLRHMIGRIGFERLQDSVWVYPYDCEDLIALLKADFHVGNDIIYMIVDSIENDRYLRLTFGLPPH